MFRFGIWLLAAAVVLTSCAPREAPLAAGPGLATTPTQYGVQATYAPLPTSTPYPVQPTYTPLLTPTRYPTESAESPAAPATETPGQTPIAPTLPGAIGGSDETAGAQKMLAALNDARARDACEPLTKDDRLQAAADAHALDLATRGAIDHDGVNGSTLQDRLTLAGYPFERRSEVIGRGTLQGVLDAWLAEPHDGAHRGALLDCGYTDAGISLRIARDSRSYWVVVLASERSQ